MPQTITTDKEFKEAIRDAIVYLLSLSSEEAKPLSIRAAINVLLKARDYMETKGGW